MLLQFEFLTERARKKLVARQNAVPEMDRPLIAKLPEILEAIVLSLRPGVNAPRPDPCGPPPLPGLGDVSDPHENIRRIRELSDAGYEPISPSRLGGPVRWHPPGSPDGFGLLLGEAFSHMLEDRLGSRWSGPIIVDGVPMEPEAVEERVQSLLDAAVELANAGWARKDGMWVSPEPGDILHFTDGAITIVRAGKRRMEEDMEGSVVEPGIHGMPDEHR